jgi:hypothetical protein
LSFGQTIGDKIEVLLGTFQGENLGESFGNLMGTHMEQKRKVAKNSSTPTSQKEKNWTPHDSMLSLSLVAWNFYFRNCLPPFLEWHDDIPKKEKT